MEQEIANVMLCLKSGLSSIIVITGTRDEMRRFRECLTDLLTKEAWQTSLLDLTANEQIITPTDNGQVDDLLIVWGLERLSPQDNRTYALRSFLDKAQYQGLKSIIFCEDAAYRPHFSAYAAPFYHFCLWHPIGGIEMKPRRPTQDAN